jgi:hypothetical protein
MTKNSYAGADRERIAASCSGRGELPSNRASLPEAGILEQNYYRWRKEYADEGGPGEAVEGSSG